MSLDEPNCAGCRTTIAELKEYRRPWPHKGETKLLCDLCAGTKVGQLDDYRHLRESPDLVEIQRQINYVGNEILSALKKSGTAHDD